MWCSRGEGKRLWPLTRDRAKPAVPFGANYRLIDFAISNLVNGRYLRVAVLTQYKSHSLDRHIAQTWRMSPLFNNYVMTVPAQMRLGRRWFEGSADAIYQNMNLIGDEAPSTSACSAPTTSIAWTPSRWSRRTSSPAPASRWPPSAYRARSPRVSVIVPARNDRIAKFQENRTTPPGSDAPDQVYASMGNYVFNTRTLIEAVRADAENKDSAHDMGGNIITGLVDAGMAAVYDLAQNRVPGSTERIEATGATSGRWTAITRRKWT